MAGAGALCQDDRARIYDIVQSFCQIHPNHTQPILRQGLERRSQPFHSVRKCLIAGQFGKPVQQMVFCIVVDRLLLESPLADPPSGIP